MGSSENVASQKHVSIQGRRLARVYAEALLNLAEKKGQVEDVKQELQGLVDVLFQLEQRFEYLLGSAAVAQKTKDRLIRTGLEGRVHPDVFNFLLLLNANGRLSLLRPIRAAYDALDDQRRKRVAVQVRSAEPLTDDQLQRLTADLRTYFQLEPTIQLTVDPALLGGLVVRVGDWVFDASIQSRLNLLRKQLIASSSHEIQRQRDRFSSDE